MNPKTVLKYASDQGAKFVSVRFTDLPGYWQHLTFPIGELDESTFEDGFGFDASSIRGWAAIHESDMLLVPDPSRMWMDPFSEHKTLCLIGNAVDPIHSRAVSPLRAVRRGRRPAGGPRPRRGLRRRHAVVVAGAAPGGIRRGIVRAGRARVPLQRSRGLDP